MEHTRADLSIFDSSKSTIDIEKGSNIGSL